MQEKYIFTHLLCPASSSLLASHSSRHAVCLQFFLSLLSVGGLFSLNSTLSFSSVFRGSLLLTEMTRAGTDKPGLVVLKEQVIKMSFTLDNKCTLYNQVQVYFVVHEWFLCFYRQSARQQGKTLMHTRIELITVPSSQNCKFLCIIEYMFLPNFITDYSNLQFSQCSQCMWIKKIKITSWNNPPWGMCRFL